MTPFETSVLESRAFLMVATMMMRSKRRKSGRGSLKKRHFSLNRSFRQRRIIYIKAGNYKIDRLFRRRNIWARTKDGSLRSTCLPMKKRWSPPSKVMYCNILFLNLQQQQKQKMKTVKQDIQVLFSVLPFGRGTTNIHLGYLFHVLWSWN